MYEEKVNPNVLSLTDAALTLIVAFMVTLPAIFWSGINVDAAKSSANSNNVTESARPGDEVIVVSIHRRWIYVNGKATAISRLKKVLASELDRRKTREIIIASDGDVVMNRVVKVLDAARLAGAHKLILLDRRKD